MPVGVEVEEQPAENGENGDNTVEAPTLGDSKQDKAERKRLEKEEKMREKAEREEEKKRKDEEKRLLKEQEKRLKEAAKQEKTALSRKQERDARYKPSALASFFSPLRPGVRPKDAVRGRVMLLDGAELELEIEVLFVDFVHFFISSSFSLQPTVLSGTVNISVTFFVWEK